MSVLLEFAMFPTDKGASVSGYVKRIIAHIRDKGYAYQLTAMGTIVETDTLDEALEVVKESYSQLETDCDRVYSSLKFDIRKGTEKRMEAKPESIIRQIGEVNL